MTKYCIINVETRECVDVQNVDNIEEISIIDGLEILSEVDSQYGDIGMFFGDSGWKTNQEWADFQRICRDMFLKSSVDRINPIRWESMNAQEKSAWSSYRQALLDVPQQQGFPATIVWPEIPN